MASKTQHTEKVRARKMRANKVNTKDFTKRLQKNIDVVRKMLTSNQ